MENEASIRETVSNLAREFSKSAADHDRTGVFPFANFNRLHEERLLGLLSPQDKGGSGLGLAAAAVVVNGIARGEPSTALVLAMHYIQHATMALRGWPSHIVEALSRETADEISIINALRVEPELGTPTRGGLPQTKARRSGDGWTVSGHKLFSTGIPILRWLAVWGVTDEEEPRVGTFLVPAGAPGITVVETWNQLGMRATASHDVLLENVYIPYDHAVELYPLGGGFGADTTQAVWSAVLLGALYDGVAQSARDWLYEFVKSRKPASLGSTLATLPRVQELAGEIEALLTVNQRLLMTTARDVDEGRELAPGESAILKLTTTANAISAVEIAIKLTGNPGLATKNPLERHFRDVICARIHTPQDDSVRLGAGKRALAI